MGQQLASKGQHLQLGSGPDEGNPQRAFTTCALCKALASQLPKWLTAGAGNRGVPTLCAHPSCLAEGQTASDLPTEAMHCRRLYMGSSWPIQAGHCRRS